MSNSYNVPNTPERKAAKAEFQLLVAMKKTEEARELEEVAYEAYRKAPTDRHLTDWQFVELNRRRAEAEEDLCRRSVEETS